MFPRTGGSPEVLAVMPDDFLAFFGGAAISGSSSVSIISSACPRLIVKPNFSLYSSAFLSRDLICPDLSLTAIVYLRSAIGRILGG